MDAELDTLAKQLGTALLARGWKLAVAESCTGGWIAKVLTDIPGSSGWFDRGYVVYSNAAKHDMLGVGAETLARHGAVSEAVVRELAERVLARADAQLSVAVSGVAGPGGGSADKPVGTVWFAWARSGGATQARRLQFPGDRTSVRAAAVRSALEGVLESVLGAQG